MQAPQRAALARSSGACGSGKRHLVAGALRKAGLQAAACAARLQQVGVARQLRAAVAASAEADARVEGTRATLASSTTAFMDQLGDARL